MRGTNCETVTLERNGKIREFKPSAKGKWDVLVSSTMQVSAGDQIRVTAGFREGKNVFKNNDIAEVREVTNTELILRDGRRMRRDGARIDQGVCITSHASQCRTVDQVVVLPDGADAKGWYVSLSRARDAMHVYTRDKAELRQSVMHPGERKSVWEFIQAMGKSKPQPRHRMMPDLWAARQAVETENLVSETGQVLASCCADPGAVPGSSTSSPNSGSTASGNAHKRRVQARHTQTPAISTPQSNSNAQSVRRHRSYLKNVRCSF